MEADLAAVHLAAIDGEVAELMRRRQEISDLPGSCKGGRIAACRIIETLTPRP